MDEIKPWKRCTGIQTDQEPSLKDILGTMEDNLQSIKSRQSEYNMSLEEEKPLRRWINIALIAQFYILDVSATAKYNIPYTPQHGQTIVFLIEKAMV